LRTRLQGATSALDIDFPIIPSGDENRRLVERVISAIDRNLSDENFGVEQLAGEIAMSRVHLYRRLREILDQSPAEIIISVRLQRAAQLLLRGAGSVSEIAYGVGFKSVSHFSKRFRQHFGRTPSEYKDTSAEK
jgi:AraC-like DNA-binding protein